MIDIKDIKTDCRFFKGDIPCTPSKLNGVNCINCNYYKPSKEKILIIKLGAAGDVIRTTPLLHPLKNKYPDSLIYWLTYSPELVPQNNSFNEKIFADRILNFNLQNILLLKEIKFDILINLDKDKEAIAIANSIQANNKFGYSIKDGVCFPINESSNHKYITGLFDEVSKKNTKSYLEEIFEMCGYKFKREKYILPINKDFDLDWDIDKSKKVVGLNTGCGSRWTSRLWKDEYWIELIKLLINKNYDVILLGGKQEDEKNKYYSNNSGAKYFGHYDLNIFINLVNKCDIVVTQVTMGLHIAIGLDKKVILLNNIFNRNEFELYDNGCIIEPEKECKCYFSPKCKNSDYNCMEYIKPETVLNKIEFLK